MLDLHINFQLSYIVFSACIDAYNGTDIMRTYCVCQETIVGPFTGYKMKLHCSNIYNSVIYLFYQITVF